MTKLSVNVNKVALLRNQRDIGIPSVIEAARACIEAGAHGITVHPRPDERHIRATDVYELSELVSGMSGVEFNIEGYPDERYLGIVRDVRPDQCTLVPDAPHQATSDHGWDLRADGERLKPVVAELAGLGCRVSLFMDPDPALIALASATGTHRLELYTEPYAAAFAAGEAGGMLEKYAEAAHLTQESGLGVNAGHDLNLKNLADFVRIPGILEVSIGHALTAEALFMGLDTTVRAYLDILAQHAPAQ